MSGGNGPSEPGSGRFGRFASYLKAKFRSVGPNLTAKMTRPVIVLGGIFVGFSWVFFGYIGFAITNHTLNQALFGQFTVGAAVFFGALALALAAVPRFWPKLDERGCWWHAAASVALVGAAWAFFSVNHNAVAIALFVGAMVLAAIPLRGSITGLTDSEQVALFVIFTLFCSEVVVGLSVTELAVFTVTGPVDLLLVMFLGVCVLGVCLGLAITWVDWPVAAPVAFGVITLALGALALQGLGPLFEGATPPRVNGAGLLFIGAPPSQPVHLTASVDNAFATSPLGFHELAGGETVQLSIAAPRDSGPSGGRCCSSETRALRSGAFSVGRTVARRIKAPPRCHRLERRPGTRRPVLGDLDRG